MQKFLHTLLLLSFLCLSWATMAQVTNFTCDFENTAENSFWTMENGSSVNQWVIGSGANHGGSNGLYIAKDGAVANEYNTYQSAHVYAYRELNLTAGVYNYSYDWRASGEGTYDFLRVALAPGDANIRGGFDLGLGSYTPPQGWISMDGSAKKSNQSTWTTFSGEIRVPIEGNYKLVFYWRNDGSGGMQPPAAIDNIIFALPSCPQPIDLVASNISSTGFTVSWTEIGNASAWQVECVPSGSDPSSNAGYIETVSEPSIDLSNLSPSSVYDVYVKSDCETEFSNLATITVRTACDVMSLPYNYSFEDTPENDFPVCWFLLDGNGYIRENTDYASYTEDGIRTLAISNGAIVASPFIPLSGNQIALDFILRTDGRDAGGLQIGFTTSLNDLSNMTIIDTAIIDMDTYVTFEYEFNTIDVFDEGYIVFQQVDNTATSTRFFLDGIRIRQASDCHRPAHLMVNNITYESAHLTWDEVDGASQYEVAYGLTNNPDTTTNIFINGIADTELDITNLLSDTVYYVWVRNNCTTEYSDWRSGGNFHTQVSCAAITDVVVSAGISGIALSWNFNQFVGAPATQVEVGWTSANNAEHDTIIIDNEYYMIQGLQPSTEYQISLRTICDTDTATAYHTSAVTQFSGLMLNDATTTNSCIPTSTNYKYSYAQMIYPASDLVGLDTILSIAFSMNTSAEYTRTIDVYMGHIKRASLTPTTYVTLDSLTLVANDAHFTTGMGWCPIVLDTPFVHQADSNLVIVVDDNTGQWKSNRQFFVHEGFSLYRNTDHSDISPNNPTELSVMQYVPDIAFAMPIHDDACEAPLLVVNEVTSNSAELVWSRNFPTDVWQVEYRLSSEDEWNIVATQVNDTHFVVSNLLPGQFYQFRVGVSCGEELLYAMAEGFTTCVAINAPYYETFSNGSLNPCWIYGNSSDGDLPVYRDSSLYMGYDADSYVILPEFAENLYPMHVMFKMKSLYGIGQLVVAVGSNPNDLSTFEPIDTCINTIIGEYEMQECTLNNYLGAGRYIGLFALTTKIHLDNILVELAPECSYPSNLSVSDIEATSATISWSGENNHTNNWMVVYGLADDLIRDSVLVAPENHSYTMTGLMGNKVYSVSVVNLCSNDTITALTSVEFRTLCGEITLPYSENFNNEPEGELHACWFTTHTHQYGWDDSEAPIVVDSYLNDGLMLKFGNNCDALTPFISVPATNLVVSFDAQVEKIENSGDLLVGFSTSNTDLSNAVYVDTISFLSNDTWSHHEISFANINVSDMGYVVFKNINNTAANEWGYETFYDGFIDNVTIMEDYGCLPVSDITISNVSTNNATISFSDEVNSDSYTIGYSTINDVNNIAFSADCSTTTYLISGLESGMRYYTWVRNNCAQGNSIWVQGPSFVTVCSAFTLPYVENFDNYTSDVVTNLHAPDNYPNHNMPRCWSFLNMSDSASGYPKAYLFNSVYSYVPYGDSLNCLILVSHRNSPLYVILPEFTTHVSDLKISFNYRNETNTPSAGTLALGVLTDPTDDSSFVLIQEYPKMKSVTSVTHNFSMDNLSADSNYVIAFRYMGGALDNFNLGIDNVRVSMGDLCPMPELISITDVTSSSVDFKWKGIAGAYNIQYRIATDTVWTDAAMETDTLSTIGGLMGATNYLLRIQSICDNSVSQWSSPIAFSTPCGAVAIPYAEDFNRYGTDIATSAQPPINYPNHTMPDCWTFPGLDNSPKIFLSRSLPYRITGNALFFISDDTDPAFAVLPQMDVDLNSLHISFAYRNESIAPNNAPLELGVMTNPNDTATFRNLHTCPLSAMFDTVDYAFSNDIFSVDSTYYIAFRYGGIGNNLMYLALDNVEVDYISSCTAPINVVASDVSYASALISWEGLASNYQVDYKAISDNDWTSSFTNNTSLFISPLSGTTRYNVRVRAICDDNDTSTWSNVIMFTTLCAPYDIPFTEDFSTINNDETPSCWNRYTGLLSEVQSGTTHLVEGGSWHIQGLSQASNLNINAHVDIYDAYIKSWLVTPNVKLTTNAEVDFDLARVDYMGNDQWNINDRFAILATNNNGTSWTMLRSWNGLEFQNIPNYDSASLRISIALDQFIGDTLRIAFYAESANGNSDHFIVVDNLYIGTPIATTCDRPTQLSVDNITTSSAELSWQGAANAFELEYRVMGTTDWNSHNLSTTLYQLDGLQPATTYEWRVRSVCDQLHSDWSSSSFITLSQTPTICETPTNLIIAVEQNSVAIDWTAPNTQNTWEISLSSASEQYFTAYTHPYTINNLTENTIYTIKVRAICGEANYSEWSAPETFTIEGTPTCEPILNLNVSAITTHTAMITWNPGGDELEWEIEYGTHNYVSGQGFNVMVNHTEYLLEDLSEGTAYDVYVRAICGDNFYSVWSDTLQFTTLNGDTPEGIDGVEGDFQLFIYPNPTSNVTTIRLNGIDGKVEIIIVDMNGRMIQTETLVCGSDCEKRFDVTNLAQGTYFVRVLGDGINSVRKLIVR